MPELGPFTLWCILVGVLLIAMTLGGSYIARLPLSAAMLYLVVGYAIGRSGVGLVDVDAMRDAPVLERLAEIAVLISLFTAGFKLGVPFRHQRWRIPVRLATVSMLVTIAAVTVAGIQLLALPLGAALLLAAILAPTDPVLASDVQLADVNDRDRLRFGLTGEGGLNDGTAFPFVMLGLGLLGLHDLGAWGWRWWTIDVVWATAGGIAIGIALGALVGRAVLHLRMRHREALGADEFIAFGLIALAYGVAVALHTYGFLAVFAAGLALRRIADVSARQPPGRAAARTADDHRESEPASMMSAVERFNQQLERFAEVAVVLTVGALLATVRLPAEALWFVPLLFLAIRPFSVFVGLSGVPMARTERVLTSWFGIRGIGSIYYLMFAIRHELDPAIAERLTGLTIAVVVASIVAHGVSVTPLMKRYERLRRMSRGDRSAQRH